MISAKSLRFGALVLVSCQLLLLFFGNLASAQDDDDLLTTIRRDVAELIQSDRPLAAKFLRLAFHDAVGGGNDGK